MLGLEIRRQMKDADWKGESQAEQVFEFELAERESSTSGQRLLGISGQPIGSFGSGKKCSFLP